MSEPILTLAPDKQDSPNIVVRVRTSVYHDHKGLHYRRDLIVMRKISSGNDFFMEDCSMGGAYLVSRRIVNLHSVEDGLYEIVIVNVSTDWETGTIDDWDYQLVAHESASPKEIVS